MAQKKRKNKAEVSISFLITMVLLVLGFAILLIFFYNLDGTGQMDRTLCHESVIYRASLPSIVKDSVPLKCQTNKICITSGRLSDLFTKSEGCEDLRNEVGIKTVKVKSEEEIAQVYAQEILACWSMMGEGKASLFSQYFAGEYGLGKVYPTCVICSRIAFDKSKITADKFDFSQVDVNRYMLTHRVPNSNKTYMEYIAGENGKVNVKEGLVGNIPIFTIDEAGNLKITSSTEANIKSEDISAEQMKANAKDYAIQTKESAIIFSQISAPSSGDSLASSMKTLVGITGASYVLAPGLTGRVLKSIGEKCASGWTGLGMCFLVGAVSTGIQQGFVAYNRYITAGYCGDVSIGTEARSGCSAVRAINYDISDISSYCSVIESTP